MAIVLFAIIGALLHAPAYYWICYGVGCFFKVLSFFIQIAKDVLED